MSTLAQRVPWLACCPCRSKAQESSNQPRPTDLAQRYVQADEHGRLCLWLQFREARPQLDVIEAQRKPRPACLRRKLCGWLGLPCVK
jgi:hypothetical protein